MDMSNKNILITGASTGLATLPPNFLQNIKTWFATMRNTNGKNKVQKDELLLLNESFFLLKTTQQL